MVSVSQERRLEPEPKVVQVNSCFLYGLVLNQIKTDVKSVFVNLNPPSWFFQQESLKRHLPKLDIIRRLYKLK